MKILSSVTLNWSICWANLPTLQFQGSLIKCKNAWLNLLHYSKWPLLITCGLPHQSGWDNPQYCEAELDPNGVHINLLEFIAIFIELWVTIRQLHINHTANNALPSEHIPAGGHRIMAVADNTSALSWLRYAARTKRPPVRRLARFLVAFLSHPFAATNLRVQGRHIPGPMNTGADLLSRFELAASWDSVTQQCPPLRPLRTCLIPRELLASLAYLVTNEPTEEWFDKKMIQLWTLELLFSGTGSCPRLWGTQTSLSPP
jgi:hypothetical protein